MYNQSIVWSDHAGKASTDGKQTILVGSEIVSHNCLYVYNSHATTGAVIKLNDNVNSQVFIPGGLNDYIALPGNFSSYEVITALVTVYAFAAGS